MVNTLLSCLLIYFGRKILVIFVKSFISFSIKATSALFNKKSEVKNDLKGRNKSILENKRSFEANENCLPIEEVLELIPNV